MSDSTERKGTDASAQAADARAEISDLEMTRLCSDAMGFTFHPVVTAGQLLVMRAPDRAGGFIYDPLHNGAQCFELVERFNISITRDHYITDVEGELFWAAEFYERTTARIWEAMDLRLSRAIVECVAKMQAALLQARP